MTNNIVKKTIFALELEKDQIIFPY